MKEALITFGKDYMDLLKHNNQFIKDHWVGLTVTTVVIAAIEVGMLYEVYDIPKKIRKKKEKKSEEETTEQEA